MENLNDKQNKQSMTVVNVISILIPVVVAILLGIRQKIDLGIWTKTLPHIIGAINTLTSLSLIIGFVLIKKKNIESHRKIMTVAFGLGALFLVCYVLYHVSNESTIFGGQGLIRYVYYFVLISHIALSLIVLPLVLRAYYYAWTGNYKMHQKLAVFAFPIWLYVSVTGVIAYLMIKPYYL